MFQVAERKNIRKEIGLSVNQDGENELCNPPPILFYAILYEKRFYISKLLEDWSIKKLNVQDEISLPKMCWGIQNGHCMLT